MEKKFDGHANKGGVYKIINKVNGKIYIGSAKRFKQRAGEHLYSLKKNKHQNKHLQNSFNKYGEDVFLFEVIEVVVGDKTARTTKEQEYINEQIELENWENCFSFKKKTVEKDRSCWSKTPEETKRILSEKGKAQWKDPEIRARRLKTIHTDEYRKKQSDKQKEVSKNPKYGNSAASHRKRMADPKNKAKLAKKLMDAWARDTDGSRRKKASELAKKTYVANKDKIFAARLKAKAKYHGKVKSPKGEIFDVYNLEKFCREHGINSSGSFWSLLHETRGVKSYKGWRKVNKY